MALLLIPFVLAVTAVVQAIHGSWFWDNTDTPPRRVTPSQLPPYEFTVSGDDIAGLI